VSEPNPSDLETDPRFPSGPWTGFFLDRRVPGRHMMELQLTFQNGVMQGEGRDYVGKFLVRGKYQTSDGQCYWTKRYVGKHDIFYRGFNEGKGIWGVWELTFLHLKLQGGFHIWPEGMPDPSAPHLTEAADLPAPVVENEKVDEPELVPAGAEASSPASRGKTINP
jgi:hypothetical protein